MRFGTAYFVVVQHFDSSCVLNQLPDLGIRYMRLSWLGWDGLNHLPEFDVAA
jgi:hypothetical protein